MRIIIVLVVVLSVVNLNCGGDSSPVSVDNNQEALQFVKYSVIVEAGQGAKNIRIISGLNSPGDVLMSTGDIDTFRVRYPHAIVIHYDKWVGVGVTGWDNCKCYYHFTSDTYLNLTYGK